MSSLGGSSKFGNFARNKSTVSKVSSTESVVWESQATGRVGRLCCAPSESRQDDELAQSHHEHACDQEVERAGDDGHGVDHQEQSPRSAQERRHHFDAGVHLKGPGATAAVNIKARSRGKAIHDNCGALL